MRQGLRTLALIFAAACAARAQDPLDDLLGLDDATTIGDGDLALAADLKLRGVRGFLETRFRSFFRDRGRVQGRNDEQWIQELQLELEFDFAPALSGFLRPRFLIGALDDDLVRTEPLEAFVTWDLGDHELRAGQLVENWGIADTFNPIDVLNRRDLAEDPLDPVRLGELGLRYRWFLNGGETVGEPVLSLYAMPLFRRALFPGDDSRWSFNPRTPAAPTAPNLDLRAGDEPRGDDGVFLAARAQSTLSTAAANADVQLVFARGPDRFPLFEPAQGSAGDVLAPTYFGSTTIGGGLRAVPNGDLLSDYTLKAEVVYRQPFRMRGRPSALPDDYVQYAFGFDRIIPDAFTDRDTLTATVEWVGEVGATDPTSLYRPFDDDLVVRLLWEANNFARQRVELRGFVDFDKREALVEASVQTQLRSIHEDLKLELGVRWFEVATDEPGFFGLFPDNSTVWTSLRLDF